MRTSKTSKDEARKTICHVIEATATGTLSMASMLASLQAARRHKVHVFYSRRPETPTDMESHFPAAAILKNIQMHTLKERIACTPTLRSALIELRPDVVFLHSSFAGFFGRLALFSTLEKAKVFYLPHCISFMREDISRIKRLALIALEMLAQIRSCTYIACSESEQDSIRKYLRASRSILIENAVPANPTKHLSKQSQPVTVINVGQIRTQKNPALFAKIAEAAQAAGLPLRFVWLGDGDPLARKKMESCHIEVTGWVPRNRVLEALTANSIFLSTSSWEGLPVALIEAQMANAPVVATACSGNRDCISHNNTGWLYKSSDEAVKILSEIIKNPSWADAVAENAGKIATIRFGQARYDKDMEGLLHAHI